MDNYIVSARKYRPATFRSVVGQQTLTNTLKNAIGSDRLAQAYLFCGPRGVGKTSCARIFAKTINCLNPTPEGEACCQCANCLAVERGTSMNVVELDAASNNSVADIRGITDQVQTPPQNGKYRVFIIDEVHMLTSAAFNAFLKTLEEPPKYVIFILATTEKHKVLPTILSRCQTYDFKRITIDDMVDQMEYIGSQEGIKTERRALEVIARKADGAMRDALSIFDQVAASSKGDITYRSTIENLNVLDYEYYFRLVETFRTGDIPKALLIYRDIRAKGFDSLFFVGGLADHVRNLMVAADPRTAELLETTKDVAERYSQQATTLPLQWYYAAIKILNDTDVQYRTASNKQLLVELALIRLCQLLKPATPPFDKVDCELPLGDITHAVSEPEHRYSAPQSTTVADNMTDSTGQTSQTSTTVQTSTISTTEHAPKIRRRAGGGFRLNAGSVAEQASQMAESHREHRAPVTLETFLAAWQNFILANPRQHILTSAMRNSNPVQTAHEEFLAKVGHPAEVQAFELAMTQLLEFLRKELGNDFITVRVEIDPERQVSKQLPPQEFLKESIEKNPDLARLLEAIDAELTL